MTFLEVSKVFLKTSACLLQSSHGCKELQQAPHEGKFKLPQRHRGVGGLSMAVLPEDCIKGCTQRQQERAWGCTQRGQGVPGPYQRAET